MSAARELRELLQRRLIQWIVLAAMLTGVAARAMWLKFSVLDLDIWWHLKVGDWIIEHRAFPHTGILSRTASDRPWSAYSWGYELLLSRAYAWFGLVGVGLFGVLLTVAVAYAVYWLLRSLSGNFWVACLLAAVSCWAFLFNIMPRPVFLSMILYAVTLNLLMRSQRDGRVQRLYWLPLIFLVWANCHIQFIYGLFIVGLFAAVPLFQQMAARLGIDAEFALPATLPAGNLLLIFAACALATCLGPYTFHLYPIIFSYAGSTFPYAFIREFRSLNFRDITHYVELLLAAAAFFTLGRQKRVDLFQLALLTVTTIVAFRTMRDSWYLCIAAAARIAAFWGKEEVHRDPDETLPEKASLAAAVALLIYLIALNTGFNTRGLDDTMSSMFPVAAVNFLRQNPQPGPLYNTFDWGGFLTWYMPNYPVSIDGRTDLYGDELDFLFFNSETGNPSYIKDPYLNEAGVVLLDRTKPLATILLGDQRFQKIYEDRLAIVFVRRQSQM